MEFWAERWEQSARDWQAMSQWVGRRTPLGGVYGQRRGRFKVLNNSPLQFDAAAEVFVKFPVLTPL